MMWSYSKMLISEEDFKLASRPKKAFASFGLLWSASAAGLRYLYLANPEPIMKKFLTKPWSVIYFASPIIAAVWFTRV